MAALRVADAGCLGDRARQQHAGGDLGVERLGRRDAHLDVATVAGVHHAVGLVGEVAVAPVDDASTVAPRPRARSTVRLVSVVVPLWLTAIDQRVAHVEAQLEAAQLGGGDRVDVEPAVAQRVEHRGHAAPGDGRSALADDPDLRDDARRQPSGDVGGQRALARRSARSMPSSSTILPRSVLRKLSGASLISFSRKCGESPRSMSRVVTSAVADVGLGDRDLRAVVGQAGHAVQLAGPRAVEHEHLTAAARLATASRRRCG